MANTSDYQPLINTFIVEDIKIFDGHKFIANGFVVVRDGIIADVVSGKPDKFIEQHILRISRPQHTLIPGLIDAHIHALAGNTDSVEQSLRFGVTTVCDMHNEVKDIMRLKQLVGEPQNKTKYSDYKYAGIGAIIEGGWPIPVMKKELESVPQGEKILKAIVSGWPKLNTSHDAKPFVQQQVNRHGASYIKMFHELGDTLGMKLPSPPIDVQKAMVKAAHEAGVIAVGHALSYTGAMDLLEAGVDGFTHIFLDEPPNDHFIKIMKSRNVHCNPTLSLCASQTAERQEWQQTFRRDPLAESMLIQKTPDKPLGLAKEQRPRAGVQHAYETTRKLYRAGVPLIAGSDCAGQGFGVTYGLGIHIEMYLFAHEIGMSPEDVLKSATSITAARFGFKDRGEISVGKKADLVLLKGDIAEVLSDPKNRCLPIAGVWRDGVLASVYERLHPEFVRVFVTDDSP
ncbi:hypothetical protein Forpe1208_v016001 [Fusarium oxysporum f. sp. rapae]|uniref:Amidohydrolase-related domain-containing protein n=1 Tax=Fusarium oxysporum f. sp. rapae TaxID=485398 RepID=A0A8J5NQA6_FUSOX|nr:hypothetical protein Forpe1208_v016001 [Fusarium oxysporum f. sp. rapae]